VSVSTVLQAYLQLEGEGLVETRPQSGHYVRSRERELPLEPLPTRPAPAPRPVTVSALVREVYAAARDPKVVPFGSSQLDPSLVPTARLGRAVSRLVREQPALTVQYDLPPGSPVLRQALARRSVTWGHALSPDDFVLTAGASEAVHLALLAVARPGDTVAIESPAYYGTLQCMEALGLKALEIPSHPRDGVQLDALEAALGRTKIAAVLLVPNFSNPLGSLMPDEAKEKLVGLLARHEVPLIEDDVYGDLHHGAHRPRVVQSFDRKGLVLLCGSFSKTLAAGYRVGWVAPGRYLERVELLKFAQSVATPTVLPLAIAELLRTGGYDRHLRSLRRHLAAQVLQVGSAIKRHFPEGTRVSRPQGGCLLWVELPGKADALQLFARARRERIGLVPGPLFSAQGRYANCLRLSCGFKLDARSEAALARLGQLAAMR
jgi:DNA-binding transcriptional MocR family regulator